ncbi:MAG: hypothetical protein ACD_76C00106G0026 [uncultured bacterium]|nr:MAG: hypothetical protein ACD_76C00106G0026 [uncultured bacterium]HBD05572.1 hypothetical protein [Candidatus Uhrbacteria bacterium]
MTIKNLLAFGLVSACFVLLVSVRFDLRFVGGNGIAKNITGTISNVIGSGIIFSNAGERMLIQNAEIHRGETIKTYKNSSAFVFVGTAEFILDENTDVEYKQMNSDGIEIYVPSGRVLVSNPESAERPVLISSPKTFVRLLNGSLEFVRFVADKKVHILPKNETIVAIISCSGDPFLTSTKQEIDENCAK